MSTLTSAELSYLQTEHPLGRLATVGPDGTPHVTPVGMWSVDPDSGVVEIRGHDLAKTKKFRDVARTGRAAIVIDDLASTNPWRPRGLEVRGQAEAITAPEPYIRIHPTRIVGWGLDAGGANARSVGTGPSR